MRNQPVLKTQRRSLPMAIDYHTIISKTTEIPTMKPDDEHQQAIRDKARQRFDEQAHDIDMESADIRKLVQELRIYKIELEIQNEDLRQAQQHLAEVA